MQNILSLFRYLSVFIVFMVLQITALSVYFTSEEYPSIQFSNSTQGFKAKIVESQNYYTRYFGLIEENKKLQRKYKRLLELNPISYVRLAPDLIKIKDTTYRQSYSYIRGEVLRTTTHKPNNFITADIGRKQGVRKGMGVINHDGLVGYVYDVSDHYCLVKTLLSENINIDVSLDKSGQFGLLKWQGKEANAVNITGIPNDIKIKKGELVVTRGTGGIFPKGISVGKVSVTKFVEGEANWDLRVKPSVNFSSVKYIFVVNHLLKEELETLEGRVDS